MPVPQHVPFHIQTVMSLGHRAPPVLPDPAERRVASSLAAAGHPPQLPSQDGSKALGPGGCREPAPCTAAARHRRSPAAAAPAPRAGGRPVPHKSNRLLFSFRRERRRMAIDALRCNHGDGARSPGCCAAGGGQWRGAHPHHTTARHLTAGAPSAAAQPHLTAGGRRPALTGLTTAGGAGLNNRCSAPLRRHQPELLALGLWHAGI